MFELDWMYIFITAISLYLIYRLYVRLQLSAAKHPSLRGHAKMSRRLARWVPFFSYNEKQFFASDDAPKEIVQTRQRRFRDLCHDLYIQAQQTIQNDRELSALSDVVFTSHYRVPFPFRNYLNDNLSLGSLVVESKGVQVKDMDGNWFYDLTGSYGVNLLGCDFYKECLDDATKSVGNLGPVLGPYHPIILDNIKHIREMSGKAEVSFHMSGTEAVMQAVRLARYHTGRTHLVRFCGAYHGWWDGVQPGVGNQRKTNDVYTLNDMSDKTLKVLNTRKDIACVLINPLQALHPNADASSDGMLLNSKRGTCYNFQKYADWLQKLQAVCQRRGIVVILDEVFVGFRFGYHGARKFFGINPDIITYGKTIGGGLPIGVVTGPKNLMRRFKDDQPANVSFARGTFNSHPLVMATMNAFLNKVRLSPWKEMINADDTLWQQRRDKFNARLKAAGIPVKVSGILSIWSVLYTKPSRYNWMYQFYLRRENLLLSWIGSGRLIFSHNYTDEDFEILAEAFVSAGQAMLDDGWWFDSALTDKEISKQIFREMLHTKFGSSVKEPDTQKPNLIGTKTDAG